MMEQQRLFLWAAFAGITLLLFSYWQNDQAAKTAISKPVNSTATVNVAASPAIEQLLPNAPEGLTTDPVVQNKSTAITRSNADKIHVKTDLYDVDIAVNNGEITGLGLLKYPKSLEQKDKPFVLFNDTPETQYIAQTNWITEKATKPIVFRAEKQHYTLGSANELAVKLIGEQNGLTIEKSYLFKRNRYLIEVQYRLINQSPQSVSGSFMAGLIRKKPTESKSYVSQTYTGAAISSAEKPYDKISFKDMAEKNIERNVNGGWAAMLQHYFVSAWIPPNNNSYRYYSKALGDENYLIGWLSSTMTIDPQKTLEWKTQLYSGPAVTEYLKQAAPHLELAVDYGMFWIFSSAIFSFMHKIHLLVGNWGVSIILVTVFIKLLFYKLSASSYRSMAKMRDITPKLQALKERYANDKQRLTQETMALYKEAKVNPLGGCLPLLIQFPVFIGLYWVLVESVELRQAPFYGWIHDLSLKDPYYILPLLMGISMFLQQRLSPAPPDPIQAKAMMLMPVVFTVFFFNFPAGLVLYWVVNNVLSILQQWWINRTYK